MPSVALSLSDFVMWRGMKKVRAVGPDDAVESTQLHRDVIYCMDRSRVRISGFSRVLFLLQVNKGGGLVEGWARGYGADQHRKTALTSSTLFTVTSLVHMSAFHPTRAEIPLRSGLWIKVPKTSIDMEYITSYLWFLLLFS